MLTDQFLRQILFFMTNNPVDIANNILAVQTKIAQLNARQTVRLLAVSKTHNAQAIRQAYQVGQRDFAENYLQEALKKITQLKASKDIIWHFIGSIQSNKTQAIAQNFSWVHSIDRLKIAQRLNQYYTKTTPLNVCLQVNIDNEPSKSGFLPSEVDDAIAQIQDYSSLKLRGLMCIPKHNNAQDAFNRLSKLFKQYPKLDTLSMGMSDDLSQAIKCGATMVRLGRAIFGNRRPLY